MKGLSRSVETEARVLTNNLFSSDLVAWNPSSALRRIEMPESDNILARRLRDAGLAAEVLERSAETQFDIDTPTDLAILWLAGRLGPRLQAEIAALDPDTERLEQVLPLLTDRTAEIIVAGRLGSETWRYLETETACRVRVFSEERGLRAAGREESGGRSLLGDLLQRAGPKGFFEVMAGLGQALLLDSRVIFSHMDWRPSPEDRFQSDRLAIDDIAHPELREFTRSALEAPIPVVLGGHTLVSGGLLLLTDVAWQQSESPGL